MNSKLGTCHMLVCDALLGTVGLFADFGGF